MVIRAYIWINTLNVNGLNAPTKRYRLAELIQKQDPYICCLKETHLGSRDTYRQKVRGMEEAIPCKWKSEEIRSSNTLIRQTRL